MIEEMSLIATATAFVLENAYKELARAKLSTYMTIASKVGTILNSVIFGSGGGDDGYMGGPAGTMHKVGTNRWFLLFLFVCLTLAILHGFHCYQKGEPPVGHSYFMCYTHDIDVAIVPGVLLSLFIIGVFESMLLCIKGRLGGKPKRVPTPQIEVSGILSGPEVLAVCGSIHDPQKLADVIAASDMAADVKIISR